MAGRIAYTGARIFDGELWWERSALVVDGDRVEAIIAADSPTDARRVALGGRLLVPGFIDLQVNGGGGAQLNASPNLATIETICATHLRFGTTGCVPTLLTDTTAIRDRAIAAAIAAADKGVTGFLGLHLEGPHLSAARKGAHDGDLIRPMDEADVTALVAARARLPQLIVTIAAEVVSPNIITRLVQAGIKVAIGHSDATYAEVKAAAEAGASLVTHLYNAQRQLSAREPGVVGAALDLGSLSAGLIADGVHVSPAAIGVALRAKQGPGRIFLVTDAMAPAGTDQASFELTGRTVTRKGGALRLADGTLAGADLTMPDAIAYMHRTLGLPLEEALRMASLYPAEALGLAAERGRFAQGLRADMALLSTELVPLQTIVGGNVVWRAAATT